MGPLRFSGWPHFSLQEGSGLLSEYPESRRNPQTTNRALRTGAKNNHGDTVTDQHGQDPSQTPDPQPTEVPPQYAPSQYAPSQYAPQPQYAPPQYNTPQVPPVQYGAQGTSPQAPQKRKRAILIGAIAGGVLLVAAAAVTAFVLLSGQGSNDPKAASPSQGKSSPAPSQTPEPKGSDSDDEPVYGPNDPEIGGTGSIGERLEAFQAQLKQSNDDGTLWKKIPQNKENTGAYIASQFILTDLKSATRFGPVSPEEATHYAKHAKHIESQLLAQKPLGTSVHYVMQDGKVFDYNGDTGAVSLAAPE